MYLFLIPTLWTVTLRFPWDCGFPFLAPSHRTSKTCLTEAIIDLGLLLQPQFRSARPVDSVAPSFGRPQVYSELWMDLCVVVLVAFWGILSPAGRCGNTPWLSRFFRLLVFPPLLMTCLNKDSVFRITGRVTGSSCCVRDVDFKTNRPSSQSWLAVHVNAAKKNSCQRCSLKIVVVVDVVCHLILSFKKKNRALVQGNVHWQFFVGILYTKKSWWESVIGVLKFCFCLISSRCWNT